MAAQITFPTSSAPGVNPHEGSGRLLNIYAEKSPPAARFPVTWRRSPGVVLETTIPNVTHCRMIFDATQAGTSGRRKTVFLVFNDEVYFGERTPDGTWFLNDIGAIPGSSRLTMAKNNRPASPHYVAATPEGAAYLLTETSVVPYTTADVDLPVGITSVAMLDGYFLFTQNNGIIWASDLNSANVATNSNVGAQGRPDGLLRGVAYRKEYFAFGDSSCEVWRDIGTSPFPLEFVTMIPRGICGTHAVAGWEEGWSNELIWAADDNRVYRLDGYVPVAVSQDAVSRAIATCANKLLLEAIVYMVGQYAMWELTSPGEWTWCYNLTTGEWHELQSNGRLDRRIRVSCQLGGEWIVGDVTTGNIGRISPTTYQEFGATLPWLIESAPVHEFPGRIMAPRLDFDFSKNTTASTVDITWSNDGGHTYVANPLTRSLTRDIVFITNTGIATSKGKRFQLTGSSNAPMAFMGAQAATVTRAA